MKTSLLKWTLRFGAIVCAATFLQAADTVRFNAQPRGSKVSVEGTSTIHDWTVEGAVVAGSFEVESAFLTDKSLKSVACLNTKGQAPKVEVTIPIRSLKSGKEKMDEIMQEAMNSKEFGQIKYKVTEMTVKGAVPDSGTPVKFSTKGNLSMSGATNSVDMEVTMERLEGDKIKFTGSKVVKMTDFKITPPAPKIALNMIKTGDEVTVKFDWVLAQKKEEAK